MSAVDFSAVEVGQGRDVIDAHFFLAFMQLDAGYQCCDRLRQSEETDRYRRVIADAMVALLDIWETKHDAGGE